MANTVRLKRSAVQGKAPVVGDLSLGELAVNTYDGKLYTKKNDGSDAIVEIGGDPSQWTTSGSDIYYNTGNVATTGTSTAASFIPTSSTVPTNGIYLPSANNVALATNGTERVEFGTSEVVFNDGGANYDFRIEGNAKANLLFVDASADQVGVGTNANGSNARFEIKSTTGSINSATLRLNSSDTTTGAVDTGSTLLLSGHDGSVSGRDFASVFGAKENSTSGNYASYLAFGTRANGGAVGERLRITSDGKVGVGTSSPLVNLDITGSTNRFLFDTNATVPEMKATNAAGNAYVLTRYNAAEHRFDISNSEKARIDSSGRLLVGTSSATEINVDISAKLKVKETAAAAVTQVYGNSMIQGIAQKNTIVRHYPVVSLGTKLIIPFVNQGNLASTTICKVWGHSARFNNPGTLAFEITFAVGHLTSLSNLATWGGNGNYASIAINGMNIEITFTTAYTSGTGDGAFVCIEYMTNVAANSIDIANIAMN